MVNVQIVDIDKAFYEAVTRPDELRKDFRSRALTLARKEGWHMSYLSQKLFGRTYALRDMAKEGRGRYVPGDAVFARADKRLKFLEEAHAEDDLRPLRLKALKEKRAALHKSGPR